MRDARQDEEQPAGEPMIKKEEDNEEKDGKDFEKK